MNCPVFERVVEELQVIPGQKLVRDFVFSQPVDVSGSRVSITLDGLSVGPLLEAIGMRLKWCLEHSITRSEGVSFSKDAIMDSLQLLGVLERLMEGLDEVDLPINFGNLEFIQEAKEELGKLLNSFFVLTGR